MSTPTEVAALVTATNNLTQTVIDKRTEITNTVNTKIQQLNNWKENLKPTDIQAEPRYESLIDLTGLPADRFYPVWWDATSNLQDVHRLTILRGFAENAALEPFGPGITHLAGLLLSIEQAGYAWGGDARFLNVVRLSQTYRKTVRKIHFRMQCASAGPIPGKPAAPWAGEAGCYTKSGCYLRGGLTYHVHSNIFQTLHYSRQTGPVLLWEHKNSNGSARWMVQSHPIDDAFLGQDYADFLTPHNAFPYTVA